MPHEIFRHEAVGLALSIRDERYRNFAMKQLERLHRKTTELSWPTKGRGGPRTQLIKKAVDQNARGSMRASNKTPLEFIGFSPQNCP
jgi:hypothetical protein